MEATEMRTNKNLKDLRNLGVDTQRFDINQRVEMILKEVAEQLLKWEKEARAIYYPEKKEVQQ